MIAAAEASFLAGAFDTALGLAATAQLQRSTSFSAPGWTYYGGNVAFASGRVSDVLHFF